LRKPLDWDNAHPYRGLGFREVKAEVQKAAYGLTELPVRRETS
jgi:hypothetical protein